MMIGSELPECKLVPKTPEQTMLELVNLSLTSDDPFGTHLKKINLRVRSGEIVGIAGVSGNGQKELMAAISGELLLDESGPIRICGQPAGRMNPAQRRRIGLTFVPEERLGRGAVPPMSLSNNALLTGSRHGMVNFGVVRRLATREYAKEVIERFKVVCGGQSAFAASLSGGNLQKYIVGRETMLKPKVMVVSQPTWGVDVGASMLIRQALIDLRDSGVAVLVISEELDELFMISDRLAVIAEGRLSATHPAAETSLDQIGVWMSGQFDAAETAVDHVG
jgi:simple sugar transport system ATP-binding protein